MAGESGRDERRKQRELEEGRKVRDVDASEGAFTRREGGNGGRCARAGAGRRRGNARDARARRARDVTDGLMRRDVGWVDPARGG